MALWRKWRKLCATYANVPSGTNIENIEKTSIYGTFGTEMPHGTLAQVAQTSYMKGEFLCLLFIIMSIMFLLFYICLRNQAFNYKCRF